jgi:methyl-accepting chemotaxis protein
MPYIDNQTIMLAIVAVTALALLLQAFVLLAIFLTVRKAARSLKEEVRTLRAAAMPVILNTQALLTRVTPNVEATLADVAAVTHGLREHTAQVETTFKDILERLRQQSSRVDEMVSSVLDAVDRAGSFLANAVSKPARQLAGLLASFKAVIESLRSSDPALRHTRSPEDDDSFV